MAGGGHGSKAVIAALLANAGIAVAKFVGFLITGASSLLAESVHSVADSGNQGLLLFGGRAARAPVSEARPFGSGRERYFWSFVVAVVLFALGSLFSLYEGSRKLRDPHEVENLLVAVVILVVGTVLEAFSFRIAVREARPLKGDQSWWRFIRTSRSPELPVVLLEDLGAQVGLAIALIGVLLAAATGNPIFDAYATLGIGVLLGVIAVILAIEMKSLLIGESATAGDVERIEEALTAAPEVERVIHLRTMHVGPDDLFVGAKVELPDHLTFSEVATTIDAAERRVREAVPAVKILYVEPDVYAAAHTGGPLPPQP